MVSAVGPKIAVLDPVVANQIAAGEVVERPASVVKELVENALDAGATRVDVKVEEGGKRLIRVRDDGCGMHPEDAILCLQRHATSKIRCSEDLHRITTLGFRGEALPSIASVSQFRLVTRPPDAEHGVEVVVEGGSVTAYNTIGCPVGTEISVRNLFFNVPARLKFLKTSTTELEHITGHVTSFSLLYHEVSLSLEHGERTLVSSPAGADRRSAVAAIYGSELAREMVPLNLEAGNIRIVGYLGKPSIARGKRTHQHLFVNGRPVHNRALTHALYDGYHTLLMVGRHPVAVVVIELDPAALDVNVHPAKSEVRFTREWEIHNLLKRGVREALTTAGLLTADGQVPGQGEGDWGTGPYRPFGNAAGMTQPPPGTQHVQGDLFAGEDPEPLPEAERLPARIRALGQIDQSYIVCDTEQGMLIIDQHALHERILYEQLAQRESERGVERQLLAVPLSLDLSPRESQAVAAHRESLSELGFEVEPFGGDAWLVRAVPALLAHRDLERLLRDVIDDLVVEGGTRSYTAHRDLVLRTMACKAAIKAGDALAPEEIDEMLRLMRTITVPYHCNHGRPTMFTIPASVLERRFGRT